MTDRRPAPVRSGRVPGSALLEAVAVMDRLRSPGGCPWDAEQTHRASRRTCSRRPTRPTRRSKSGDSDGLRDELGDVLLQVLFHARIASEEPRGWDIDDVAAGLVAKLVRRHPHVFADTEVSGSADVEANWDEIKETEKPARGVTEGVPTALPALALAAKLQSAAPEGRCLVGPRRSGEQLRRLPPRRRAGRADRGQPSPSC